MREIRLSDSRPCPNRGRYVAIVDDNQYESLSSFSWTAFTKPNSLVGKSVHAWRQEWLSSGRHPRFWMHRVVWENVHGQIPDGMTIDHREHGEYGGLDNRLSNLRLASFKDQQGNKRKAPNTSSRFKGVCWDKSRNVWLAKIYIDNTYTHIGRFDSEADAANAYNVAALSHFGDFARLNSAG